MLSKTIVKRRIQHFWELKQYPKVSGINHIIKNKAGPYLGQDSYFHNQLNMSINYRKKYFQKKKND